MCVVCQDESLTWSSAKPLYTLLIAPNVNPHALNVVGQKLNQKMSFIWKEDQESRAGCSTPEASKGTAPVSVGSQRESLLLG
jgi:hypothetical protein